MFSSYFSQKQKYTWLLKLNGNISQLYRTSISTSIHNQLRGNKTEQKKKKKLNYTGRPVFTIKVRLIYFYGFISRVRVLVWVSIRTDIINNVELFKPYAFYRQLYNIITVSKNLSRKNVSVFYSSDNFLRTIRQYVITTRTMTNHSEYFGWQILSYNSRQ